MKLSELIAKFGLTVISPGRGGDVEVERGYASDLLSDVIANAGENCVWVTMQTHVNVIAVAALKDLAAIVLVGGRSPDEATVAVAKDKKVCVLGTNLPAFEISGKLYAEGLTGGKGGQSGGHAATKM